MADLSLTAASVARVTGDTRQGTAGVTITAGQLLYVAADGTLQTTDADASLLRATVVGVALHASLANQPITYQVTGTITIGATVAVGTVYCASATAGGGLIAPIADQTTGWYSGSIGTAISTTVIQLNIQNLGVVHA